MAASRHAALYIGHYPEGLAAAAAAAREVGAKLAFDAEDFHTGEPEGGDDLIHVDSLQRRYLPLCDYVTAGSVGIANALTREYGIRPPTAIYNVFPLQDRERLDGLTRDRCGDYLSLYWYSQVIGLDRGIQDAIRAAGLLKGPVQIHLRGIVNGDVREALLGLAHECGVADYVYFHDVVPPGELLSRTAEHDVGLALEDGSVYNRAICTTNKLFFYMLAGLAVAATAVPGQAAVLSGNTTAAAIYPARDYERLAGILEAWRVDRARLSRAKAAAAQWAEERWNWENESAKLVAIVSRTMGERSKNMATFAETRVS
jgi:glycosyltransferase involved in cell wall biosynthesis